MLSASRREGRGARPESDELRRLGAAHEGARPRGLAPRGWEGWVRRKTEPFPSLHPGQGGGLVWHTETRERRASGLFVMDTHLISPKRNSRGFLWSGFCRRGQTTSKNKGGQSDPPAVSPSGSSPLPSPLAPTFAALSGGEDAELVGLLLLPLPQLAQPLLPVVLRDRRWEGGQAPATGWAP